MKPMAICPKCRVLLSAKPESEFEFGCSKCSGYYLRRDSSLGATPEYLVKESKEGETPLACPDCLAPMEAIQSNQQGKAVSRYHCQACDGIWMDSPPTPASETVSDSEIELQETAHPGFVKSLMYGMSLPERIVRSAVGLTAGTVREAAQLMIPKSFQSSKSYEVAITNSLNFLTDVVGGFDAKDDSPADVGEHLAKKAVGNFVDLAGVATLHISPMWMLAAVSDVAYGSSTYLKELAVELEKQGIIDEASTIHHVDDFLDAIQNTSGQVASSFDKPPLSVDELKQFVAETRASVSKAEIQKLIPESEMRKYWESLHQAAIQEKVTPFEAATAVAMHTAQQASAITHTGITGVRVAGSLLQRNILQHYQDSLQLLYNEGFLNVIRGTYQPYVSQVWSNFSADRKSWTESIFDPDRLMSLFGKKKA